MDYDELEKKYGGRSATGENGGPSKLIVALSLIVIAVTIGALYLYMNSSDSNPNGDNSNGVVPNGEDSSPVKLDEASCMLLLSDYDPEVTDLEYEEVYSERRLNFSEVDTASRWKINNRGDIVWDQEFLPGIQFYKFRTFFVWDGDEFEGCGIHNTFYNDTKRVFEQHYVCEGGDVEEGPTDVYIEHDDDKGYYSIAYEIIDELDNSTIKSTYHITFSNDPTDLRNGLNLLNMYGCE